MSVRGSTRRWTEVHTRTAIAAVAPGQAGVVAEWRTRGHDFATAAGGMMAIEPGEVHVTKNVSAPADFDLVQLAPELVQEAVESMELSGEFHFAASSCEDAVVMRSLRALVAAHARGEERLGVELELAELLSNVVLRLGEVRPTCLAVRDPVSDYRLRRAREYLLDRLDMRPSLDELAREVGMSKFWLCSQFKAAYGVSIGDYWGAARVNKAKSLLRSSRSIRDTAAELRFVDAAFFSRVFKKHVGLPPGAWLSLYDERSAKRSRPHQQAREHRPLHSEYGG